MKKSLIKATFIVALGLGVAFGIATADPIKGGKVLDRAIHKYCNMPSTSIALMHSVDEWKNIIASGQLEAEITKLCKSKQEIDPIRKKYMQSVAEFLEHYANDSGAIPA
jgi:hypothetical protein